MNDCYLSLLLNFRALLSIDSGANLVNSKQAIGVILPDLSLLGYAVPVESFGIGLFIVLFAYLAVEYNGKRLRDSILSPFFHSYIFAMYKNEALWI